MKKNRRFKGGEIPTSSMADIAFLLLIFFLVTTTIDTDKGLGIILPPPGDMEIEIRKENILNCLINSQGKVLLDEEPTNVEQLHRIVGDKIRANDKLVISKTSNAINPLVYNMKPVLGCDVWEHSYYIDYQNKSPEYLENFFEKLVNWEFVNSNLD